MSSNITKVSGYNPLYKASELRRLYPENFRDKIPQSIASWNEVAKAPTSSRHQIKRANKEIHSLHRLLRHSDPARHPDQAQDSRRYYRW